MQKRLSVLKGAYGTTRLGHTDINIPKTYNAVYVLN